MTAVSLLVGETVIRQPLDIVKYLIWPTRFWFVGAILLFYILIDIIPERYVRDKKAFIILLTTLTIVDIVIWMLFVPDKSTWVVEDVRLLHVFPFKVIYGFIEFCLGYYIKANKIRISKRMAGVFSVFTLFGFYAYKYMLNKGIVPMETQLLTQILTIGCGISVFLLFLGIDMNKTIEGKKIARSINYISGLSLEVYVVQFLIISWIYSLNIAFPANMVVCFSVILLAAWILHIVYTRIYRKISALLKL